MRLAALEALRLITPQGHDQTTRRVLMVLRDSWDLLIRDFTGCARDADQPHRGCAGDYGMSRGPVSLRAQLRAIEREAPGRCPAKCGQTAAAVRIAAIEVLVAIAVRKSDLAARREELLATVPDPRASLSRSRGGSAANSASSTPFSLSRVESRSSSAERNARKLARQRLKIEQDKAFGDIVRHTAVVEGLCQRLSDMDREVRWTAAQALVQDIAEVDDLIVMEALAKCLEHSEEEVQQLAIQMIKGSALGVCITPGHQEMTSALCKRFASTRKEVRAAAAGALVHHCKPGDATAVTFLIPLLWHADSHVRQDCLTTLSNLVPKGAVEVVRQVERGAFEPDPAIRIMAIYALSELADSDDNVTAALLEDLLFDQDDAVVCAATYAVAQLAKRGDAESLDVLLNNCQDMSEAVRRASIDALTRVSAKGDAAVVDAALKLVDDPDASVRKQALETLTKVSDKGNTKVCTKIIARLATQGGNGVRAIADLRDLRWSTGRSLGFTFGSVGPPGTTHSDMFGFSKPPQGLVLSENFRMPGGIPVTDGADIRSRSKTWGGPRSEKGAPLSVKSIENAAVTWGPTQRWPTTKTAGSRSLADAEGYADAPVESRPPATCVIHLPFSVRPPTAPTLGPPLVFRLGSDLHAVSRPGTRQSKRLATASPDAGVEVSSLARALYSPLLMVDCDGGYDSMFGLIVLALAGLVPQLVTTVHGMGEAVSSAVNIKRLYATLQLPEVAVVPSVDTAEERNRVGRLCLSRPGTSMVRLDGSTRRVPSRFGPDYRRHLAQLADHLFLAPLGISHPHLLEPPGLTLRVANLEKDLRLLAMVAGADVGDLEDSLASLVHALDELNRRGKGYYAAQGRGLSRDGRVGTPSSQEDAPHRKIAAGSCQHASTLTTGTLPTRARQRSEVRPQSRSGGILRPSSRAASGGAGRCSSRGVTPAEMAVIKTPAAAEAAAGSAARRTTFASDQFHSQNLQASRADWGGAAERGDREGGVGDGAIAEFNIMDFSKEDGAAGAIEVWGVEAEREGRIGKEAKRAIPPWVPHAGGIAPTCDAAPCRAAVASDTAAASDLGASGILSESLANGNRSGHSWSMPNPPLSSARAETDKPLAASGDLVETPACAPPPWSAGSKKEVNNRAVAALLEELREQDDHSFTLLCLGSLTNLAGALDADHDLVHRKLKNVVVMGGAARVRPSAWHDHAFYTQGGAEFNFYFDADATYKVIHSGLDISMVGLEVANADVCTPQQLQDLVSEQLGQANKDKEGVSTPAWLLKSLMLAFDMSVSYAAVASFHLVHPEHFRLEKVWVRVEQHTGKITEVPCCFAFAVHVSPRFCCS